MKHWLSHLLFLAFHRLIILLPMDWVAPASGALARLAIALGVGKRIVLRNLEIAFGNEMSLAAREELYRSNIRAYSLSFLEILWMTQHDREWVRRQASIFGWEHVETALTLRRGVLMLGGHLGNIELQNAVLALASNGRCHSYTGHQRNPHLEKFMMRLRVHAGVQPVPKSPETGRRMIQVLKDNCLMGICGDVNTRQAPVFVPFFGKLASVPEGMATLAVKSDCPVLFSWITRVAPFQHRIFIKPLVYPRIGNLRRDQEALAKCFLQELENVIRVQPAEYLWMYKRYRTRPAEDPDPVY